MKIRNKKEIRTYLFLNLIWGSLTVLLLLFIFYFSWQKEQLQTQDILYRSADDVADQLDHFISEMVQIAVTLPPYPDASACPSGLLSQLQTIVAGNPRISGLIVENKKKRWACSTFKPPQALPMAKAQTSILSGPMSLPKKKKSFFILHQPLGDYLIHIYFPQDLIKNNLKISSPFVQEIALYDGIRHKIIFKLLQQNGNWEWSHTAEKEKETEFSLANYPIQIYLNNLEKYRILLTTNPGSVRHFTWHHEIILALLLLTLTALIWYSLYNLKQQRFSLHRALQNALKSNQFFPVYQPIFNNEFSICAGAEVLLRWSSTDSEIIMPDYFIEDAEQSGLIVPITLQLIEKAFQDCQIVLMGNPQFYLSFNVSAVHFRDKYFFASFLNLCEKYHVPSRQVMLEVTERSLLNRHDLALTRQMLDLRQRGFSLAVDDFGTGYASISYLRHLPFNYLKIDQLFVRAIGTGAITETLSQSILQMAKNLNLQIIAEGVESLTQFEFLKAQGVALMQGWYFAKAMSCEQFIAFIKGVRYA
ncbi:EAL domain-containing protein [Legionella septentrionalis]|uniref:EAL domain-containing protein n=1 Tax=Legionella septentrionalis TaxID=2498109 RepID=A0A433JKR9_9GAMM|nr:EAL domain-containing protein [Legionella septentrionalis]RUQ89504.1 EAL domain-containing protein [Legionella septentrionalis]RUQ97344.1 EAL domain-containing protein [Legionella septentrionalis]RUR16137.1 EAL domain-containing protein [Legionella septentrionalis]